MAKGREKKWPTNEKQEVRKPEIWEKTSMEQKGEKRSSRKIILFLLGPSLFKGVVCSAGTFAAILMAKPDLISAHAQIFIAQSQLLTVNAKLFATNRSL